VEVTGDTSARLTLVPAFVGVTSDICYPWQGAGNTLLGRGRAWLALRWRLVDTESGALVIERRSEGDAEVAENVDAVRRTLLTIAIEEAVANLLADPEVVALLEGEAAP